MAAPAAKMVRSGIDVLGDELKRWSTWLRA